MVFLLTSLITRQLYLKFKFFEPGYLKGSKEFGRMWNAEGIYPLFGKIFLFTDKGLAISAGYVFNAPATNLIAKFFRKFYFNGKEDTLINGGAIHKITCRSINEKKHTVTIQYNTQDEVSYKLSGYTNTIKDFCTCFSIAYGEF